MADFTAALAAAHDLYKDAKNAEAVAKYTEALKVAPEKFKHSTLLSRARAYYRVGKYQRALADCFAVLSGPDPSLKVSANQLKGECFLQDADYENAHDAFEEALGLAKTSAAKQALNAFLEATNKASKEGQPPDLAALKPMSAAASAKDRGYKPAPKATSALEEQIAAGRSAATSAGNGVDEDMDAENVAAGGNSAAHDFDAGKQAARINAAMSRPGPAVRAEELSTEENPFAGHVPLEKPSKYRLQYNQNAGSVEVQVFAKKLNTQKERVRVDITAQHLKVEILDEACENVEYSFDDDLYHEVDPEQSKFSILSTQVLVKMKKVDGSISWPTLGKSEAPAVAGGASIVDAQAGPAREYPSSHRKGHTDWNKLESDVKQEEKDEKLDGEAGLQKFFQGLYGSLDEDARRAMNKSFQESGGTTLSTNWKDIGAKTLKCEPPEGVAVKKFEQ